MPKPMPCVPPAPSVCQGMDLYEAMNGLTDRVNTCIATYNDVMANSYQALRNLEHAAEANGAYYGDCEVSTEQGYYADEGNTYVFCPIATIGATAVATSSLTSPSTIILPTQDIEFSTPSLRS